MTTNTDTNILDATIAFGKRMAEAQERSRQEPIDLTETTKLAEPERKAARENVSKVAIEALRRAGGDLDKALDLIVKDPGARFTFVGYFGPRILKGDFPIRDFLLDQIVKYARRAIPQT